MNQKSNAFLETQPIGGLMRKYAIPCIISLAYFASMRSTSSLNSLASDCVDFNSVSRAAGGQDI